MLSPPRLPALYVGFNAVAYRPPPTLKAYAFKTIHSSIPNAKAFKWMRAKTYFTSLDHMYKYTYHQCVK
jgi:hypothetical protein